MEIDLDHLPIPDWGVLCPKCRYPLVGLPSHRCPECGTKLDMGEIVKTWHRLRDPRFTGHELPQPDFGLLCDACHQPLAGTTTFQCPSCGVAFDPEAIRPRRKWFLVDQIMCSDVALASLEALLGTEHVPYMHASGKLLAEIFGFRRIVGSPLLAPREFYFEVLWLIRQAAQELQHVRQQPGERWTCANCGEKVPNHFDVCWNCETARER
jgi:predicted amidophosphoribosyltransferase